MAEFTHAFWIEGEKGVFETDDMDLEKHHNHLDLILKWHVDMTVDGTVAVRHTSMKDGKFDDNGGSDHPNSRPSQQSLSN